MTSPTKPTADTTTPADPSVSEEESVRPQLRVVRPAVATDGEVPIGSSGPSEAAGSGPTRDARTGARASVDNDPSVTERNWTPRSLLTAAGAWARPPDIWSQDRPSLRKQLNYARWGSQHPEGGPLRALSIGWCCLGLLPQTIAYYVAWAAERPGRLLSLYVLWAVLLQIPVVRAVVLPVVHVLTAPMTWLG